MRLESSGLKERTVLGFSTFWKEGTHEGSSRHGEQKKGHWLPAPARETIDLQPTLHIIQN